VWIANPRTGTHPFPSFDACESIYVPNVSDERLSMTDVKPDWQQKCAQP